VSAANGAPAAYRADVTLELRPHDPAWLAGAEVMAAAPGLFQEGGTAVPGLPASR
jgi:hypothetical protein